MGKTAAARALYLNRTTDGVFGLYHDAPESTGRAAVLICPPFGLDPVCPYRGRRNWAAHLAGEGHPTLRIALPGSGDSTGLPTDPAQLEAWTQAVSAAARWLGDTSGATRVVAAGIGLGGLVAHRAAFAGAPIDDLVLWGVPGRGRALVRELRAYARLPSSSVLESDDDRHAPLPEGAVLAAGYVLSAETAAALEALDLTELPLPDAARRRALLLSRSGPRVDEALREALACSGVEVSVEQGAGIGPMRGVFGRVDRWLRAGESHDRAAAMRAWSTRSRATTVDAQPLESTRPSERARPLAGTQPTAHPTARDDAWPASHEQLLLAHDGVELRETPIWIERPQGRLFGVLSEPLEEPAQLCALLLSPQGHAGASRIWVEIARRWATRGVATLRVDLSCLGDSEGERDRSMYGGSLYEPEYVAETCAVLDVLAARGLPQRFVTVGLCAGAYWASHAALRDARVRAAIMLNPRMLVWSGGAPSLSARRKLAKRLLRRTTLRRALRGEIPPQRIVHVTRTLARASAAGAQRRMTRAVVQARGGIGVNGANGANAHRNGATQAADASSVEALLDALRDRDQRALLMLTTGDAQRTRLASETHEQLSRWPNLQLETVKTSTESHMLTQLWLQRRVHELVDGALDRELERLAESAVSLPA